MDLLFAKLSRQVSSCLHPESIGIPSKAIPLHLAHPTTSIMASDCSVVVIASEGRISIAAEAGRAAPVAAGEGEARVRVGTGACWSAVSGSD